MKPTKIQGEKTYLPRSLIGSPEIYKKMTNMLKQPLLKLKLYREADFNSYASKQGHIVGGKKLRANVKDLKDLEGNESF